MKTFKNFLNETIKQGIKATIAPKYGAIVQSNDQKTYKTTNISINKLKPNENKIQAFDSNNPYVNSIRNSYLQRKVTPPIIITRIPISQGKTHIVVDGHHRLEAAKRAKQIEIPSIELHHTDVTYTSKRGMKRKIKKENLLEAKLSDYAHIGTEMKDADFWVVRRGSRETIGKPVKEFNPEHIGIKIHRTDVLHPQYMFYALHHLHSQGMWYRQHSGATNLVNITTKQIKDIKLG